MWSEERRKLGRVETRIGKRMIFRKQLFAAMATLALLRYLVLGGNARRVGVLRGLESMPGGFVVFARRCFSNASSVGQEETLNNS